MDHDLGAVRREALVLGGQAERPLQGDVGVGNRRRVFGARIYSRRSSRPAPRRRGGERERAWRRPQSAWECEEAHSGSAPLRSPRSRWCSAPATAAAVAPYGTHDAGGFRNVLPPGEAGADNAAQLAQFEANGTYPAHFTDQQPLYDNLITGSPRR